uniref:Reverse transcriptase domain-containing protein n=1 Tax=Oreochromis niloticus TaxID=8128 RepID=A0A669B6K4_ORENI
MVCPPSKRRRRRRERKQKRGCRSGSDARLRKQPHRPALPSLFVSNARSITHKLDELELQIATTSFARNCSIILITESWLHPLIPDAAVELAGRTLHRHDRNSNSGKSRGGGLCVYVHNEWCCNSRIIHTHCSPDLEVLAVSCRPFYIPREFTVVIVIAVYIPPDANVGTALSLLLNTINKQQLAHPDGVFIVAGDFNKACLKTVLPKFVQFVDFATRGEHTLDHVYSNIRHAFRATPLPHLAGSDHLCMSLTPTYTPLLRKTKPQTKTIKTWPEGALSQLQDCFSTTVWDLFSSHNLQEYTDTVLSYIRNCVDNVTVNKRVRVFPNQKPWMNSEVQSLLKSRNTAFKSGDRAAYRAARADLSRGIRKAKAAYRRRIEDHFADNDPRKMWQGINHITNYRSNNQATSRIDASLAEDLNRFFARFETTRPSAVTPLPPAPSTGTLTLREHQVRCVLRSVNPRKAAGPDGIHGKVLRACADELTGVFTKIFNLSLSLNTVPPCLKTSTIIPIAKKTAVVSPNDYRPVALTPVVMKCFERLVCQHIRASLPPTLDPHQFAYRTNRSTEDAITIALHTALSHLEHRGSYVRMLFLDFSSAFNHIIPEILVQKLSHLGLSTPICLWIKDVLTNRPHSVRLGPHLSSTITLSTGSPQGCVLSPLLFTLYTSDCSPTHLSNTIIKFADDTTVVGLISRGMSRTTEMRSTD